MDDPKQVAQTAIWTRDAVEAFVTRFEQCRVRKQEWTHQAHLVTGFWYVHTLGLNGAIETMRTGVRRHNEAVGTPNTDSSGYHETITCLFLQQMDGHLRKEPTLAFERSLEKLLTSPLASSAWPLTLYSRERLFSVEARKAWIEPDLPAQRI